MVIERLEDDVLRNLIIKSVKECNDSGEPASRTKLIAVMWQDYGKAQRSASEFLKMMDTLKQIKIDGDNVWDRQRWLKILQARALDYMHMEDILDGQGNTGKEKGLD